MARIISIAALPAGAGKTLSAINLAAAFAAFEQKTLLMDCAPDNRCLAGSVIAPPTGAAGLAEAFAGGRDVARYFVPTCLPALRVLAAGRDPERAFAAGREGARWFSEMICTQAREHDVIVMDTGTGFSDLREWVFCASDELVIPMRIDPAAFGSIGNRLAGISRLLEQAARLRRERKTDVRVSGILLNCCEHFLEAEALLGPDVFDTIRDLCLPVTIPEDPGLHEAFCLGKPVVCHDIGSPGARAFLDLAALWGRTPKKRKPDREEF